MSVPRWTRSSGQIAQVFSAATFLVGQKRASNSRCNTIVESLGWTGLLPHDFWPMAFSERTCRLRQQHTFILHCESAMKQQKFESRIGAEKVKSDVR
jgi:hypothetical protein